MLEKSMYNSWKSRMELYIENRENARMILNSVLNGPLIWPTVNEENGLIVPLFTQGDDPIACRNKAMAFLIVVASLRFPSTNNQLRTSTNQRNQDTIQDGGQVRVVKCYNFQGEGHKARQCTQLKRPRNAAWFKEKAMLAEAHESGQILNQEQLSFLTDPGIPDGQAAQKTIPNTFYFQTEDLDAYDSDCDDVSNAKTVLMANLSNYGSDIISKVPHFEPYYTDMDNQSVHAMQSFEKTSFVDFTDNEITNGSVDCFKNGLYTPANANDNGNGTKLSVVKDYGILDLSHKHYCIDEAVGTNTRFAIEDNTCGMPSHTEVNIVEPFHLVIAQCKRPKRKRTCSLGPYQSQRINNNTKQTLITAQPKTHNYQADTKLSVVKDYGNQNLSHKYYSIDEAVGTNALMKVTNRPSKVDRSTRYTRSAVANNTSGMASCKCPLTYLLKFTYNFIMEVNIVEPFYSAMAQCKRKKRKKTCFVGPYRPQRVNNNTKCVCRWQKSCVVRIGTQYSGEESISVSNRRIVLQPPPEYPQYIKELYENTHFMENIRAYNQMFSMTSLGANIDKSINNGKGIYDDILQGDRDGSDLGLRTVLTASFTGCPRYMYAHYLDALLIADDRADIVDHIFEKKVRDYIKFVLLYTIEFQKQGLPHYHSLLWISNTSRAHQDIDVDKYICAELPDLRTDADGFAVILEFMIHRPCGYENSNATCMKDGDFRLPIPPEDMLLILQNRLLMEETNYNQQLLLDENNFLIPRLNKDQKLIFVEITNVAKCNIQKLIFVYRHGGTGKTFLWKAITSALRSEEKIVLTVAASGITALLLPSGRTVHPCFQILLNLKDECICRIKNSQLADLLSPMTKSNDQSMVPADKGKLPLIEENTVSLADIKPTQTNQTIEVRVYRKWVAKNVKTQVASNFCAMLLDTKGNAIQANMDLRDTNYFNQQLQLNNAYIISRFMCTTTKIWDRTLPNNTTLLFRRYTSIIPISNTNFPEHYFNFIAYNEVSARANISGAPLINYSLWEVIMNGDSPLPTRIVDGVVQIVAPTNEKQRLAKKNKLKARGTLLMALSDKHQLNFNIHKDAKSLMEAIEKRFGVTTAPSISAASLKATVTTLPNVDSLSDVVIYSFFSNSPQLNNKDLKQIDPDDLEKIDLKWQMAMLTIRARRFLKRTGRNLDVNGTDTIRFDMSKVECYNFHRRGHFARECRSPRDNRNKETTRRTIPMEVSTSNALVSQCDAVGGYDWSFQADEEPTNYALMAYASSGSSSFLGSNNEVVPCSIACSKAYATLQTHYDNLTVEFRKSQLDVLSYKTGLESVEARLVVYQKNKTVFEEDIKLLKLDVMLRDNALAELRKKFKKAEKERNELKLTLDKFQTSFKNLSKLLESQVSDKTSLGFDSQVFNCQVSECEELHSHESDNKVPKNPENDTYTTGEGYHAVPPLYTRTFLPPKLDLVFTDDPNASESVANVFNVESSTNKDSKDMSKTHRPAAPIIEDWISDSEDETKIEEFVNKVKLKTKKQKMVVTVNVASNIPSGGTLHIPAASPSVSIAVPPGPSDVPPGTFAVPTVASTVPTGGPNVPTNVPSSAAPAGVSSKGKSPMVEEDIPIKARTFKQMEEDKLGEEAAKQLRDEEMAQMERQRAEMQKKRQQDVLDSAMYYNEADWLNIRAQVEANASLFKTLLGDDVSENNFPARMAALIKKKRQALAEQFQIQAFRRTLKRLGPVLEEPSSKRQQSTDTLSPSVPKVRHSPVVSSPPSSHTRRKSFGRKHIHKPKSILSKLDLDADAQMFIKVVVNEDSDDEDSDVEVWSAVVGWEVLPIPLGEINALYRIDGSTKHFASMFDPLYGGSTGSYEAIWLSETVSGEVLSMFTDVSYPLSVKLMERMLMHKLEIDLDVVGNDMTTAEQLIQYVVPTGRVIVPTGRYVVPTGRVIVATSRKSSFVDPYKYHDDPDIPKLEDIVYSDDEEDVGTEADLSNLETNILVSPIPTTRVHKDHPINQITGDLNSAPQTRSMTRMVKEQGGLHQINDKDFYTCMFSCFLSQEEPKKVLQALKDPSWIKAIQEELLQFNCKRNKARLVAQGHTQEEGIEYDEVFAPVARIEAKWLFLAYDSFMGFMVHQMDVKSAFLYGTTKEEVYVFQPLGFEDLDYSNKVYKVVKAFYGLHQAPRAWYETLANYLLENGFQNEKIDQTLFIKKQKGDILLVQVYVDDIIFGTTNKELCKDFEKLMKDKFQMSSIGEITFFLRLQVKQKDDGIFISQDKYVAEILRKFGLTYVKSASTPIETDKPLLKDLDGKDMDVHIYRSMIRSLMYLTSSRLDIMFVVCACTRFQVTPKVSHLHAVKRSFRYLKGKPHLGLWYPRASPFNLVAYSNSDYARASLDWKSTIFNAAGHFITAVSYELMLFGPPLFASMLVQPQPQAGEEDPTSTPLATPPQDQPLTPYASPPQEQPTTPHESSMPLLTTLMETYETLSQKLEKKQKSKSSGFKRLRKVGGKIEAIDADEGITLVDVEADKEVFAMDAKTGERLNQEEVSVAEPTVFDDEDVTMIMA
uniref:ATP-dependent DNA helicase n=1 Tax=Tanacetum cinerariifolium TaxID=118510 RepID=A0A6L2JFN4_TANCI|nr:hypothetical protein [Tanacetum cinerariifolium]